MEEQNNITKNVYFECFELVTYKNTKKTCKGETKRKGNYEISKLRKEITRNVYYECLSFLKYKTLNQLNSTVNGET